MNSELILVPNIPPIQYAMRYGFKAYQGNWCWRGTLFFVGSLPLTISIETIREFWLPCAACGIQACELWLENPEFNKGGSEFQRAVVLKRSWESLNRKLLEKLEE